MPPHIFISYSSKDRALVEELAADLDFLVEGCTVWFDRELNRSGGHRWWSLILEQICKCDVFVYAITPNILRSEPCRREYGYATALDKPVLPVLLAETGYRLLPLALQEAQIVNFRVRDRLQQRSLRDSVRNLPPAPPLPDNDVLAALAARFPAPLDPMGVLHSRIAQLTADPDAQKLLLVDIEDVADEGNPAGAAELLARLLDRDEILITRTTRRATDMLNRLNAEIPTPPPITHTTPRSKVYDILPAPFEWIDIPAGSVTLIPDDTDKKESYLKQSTIYQVPAFAIAKYPVTNAHFRKFMEAGGYREQRWWTPDGWQARETNQWTEPRYWQNSTFNPADHPVVGVSWYEAVAFSHWLVSACGEKIALLTEQQWQRAAQGNEGWAYPWGNDWDGARCNNSVKPYDSNATTSVTAYAGREKGDSFFGVSDMAGNIWEWCSTRYNSGEIGLNGTDVRVLRGGSWRSYNSSGIRVDYRGRSNPGDGVSNYGFRIARPYN